MSDTFEAIKARHDGEQKNIDMHLSCTSQEHQDKAALIAMVEALQHLAHPLDETRGICPLVLYFPTEENRQGFAEIVKEGFPDWRAVKLP